MTRPDCTRMQLRLKVWSVVIDDDRKEMSSAQLVLSSPWTGMITFASLEPVQVSSLEPVQVSRTVQGLEPVQVSRTVS